MNICGFLKNSFIDYPSYIACVVFTGGCNLDCWYCHNNSIIADDIKGTFNDEEIFEFLKKRKGMIDGVVISGGEPTLQKDLFQFMDKVKKLGFRLKLDTNGTNPEVLGRLLENKLVDYVAIDVKTSFEKYNVLTRKNVDVEKIKKSISLVKNSEIEFEFRTTFAPDVTFDDIASIGEYCLGANRFSLQKYRPNSEEALIIIPHSKEDYLKAKEILQKYIKNVEIKGF